MSVTIIKNIKQLYGVHQPVKPLRGEALSRLPAQANAYLLIEDGVISGFGSMVDMDFSTAENSSIIDAADSLVLPAWCDSHTHLVFAGWRENEFVDKINGLTYAEIAAKGGGILQSASRVREASEDQLFAEAWERLRQISLLGTGSVEIKSGYGLDPDSELKMLRVIRRLKERSSLSIKSTLLAAHAIPLEYRNNRDGYIRQILDVVIPAAAREKLADFIDVFCEEGFFTPAETELICAEGMKFGMKAKVHANQLNISGGVQAGVNVGAISVDHLESLDDPAISYLSDSETIGTMLPTAAYFLRMAFPPARKLINAGCAVALASDFNPGSSPSGNMNLVVSMACIQMKMKPEEAVNAATINGAFAMELNASTGSIAVGKRADLILTKPVPSLAFLPYAFGSNNIARVMIKGEWIS